MAILQKCWTPFMIYSWTSLKLGCIYCAMYTTVIHILCICYSIYVINGGNSDEFYSPFFELERHGLTAAVSFSIVFSLIFIVLSALLVIGVRKDNRGLFLPWMFATVFEILLAVCFGLWLLYRYYRNLYSLLAAIIIWTLDGIHVYCLLCVISQYQVIKERQEPSFVILYP